MPAGVILCSDREVVFDIDKGEIRDGALDDDFALFFAVSSAKPVIW